MNTLPAPRSAVFPQHEVKLSWGFYFLVILHKSGLSHVLSVCFIFFIFLIHIILDLCS